LVYGKDRREMVKLWRAQNERRGRDVTCLGSVNATEELGLRRGIRNFGKAIALVAT
jgi:hypothetical protein